VRTPIKAAAHAPIKQAGYISATSGIQKILSCEQQPVHTSGSNPKENSLVVDFRYWANIGSFRYLFRNRTQDIGNWGMALSPDKSAGPPCDDKDHQRMRNFHDFKINQMVVEFDPGSL
jgi:hypothetical protein